MKPGDEEWKKMCDEWDWLALLIIIFAPIWGSELVLFIEDYLSWLMK